MTWRYCHPDFMGSWDNRKAMTRELDETHRLIPEQVCRYMGHEWETTIDTNTWREQKCTKCVVTRWWDGELD